MEQQSRTIKRIRTQPDKRVTVPDELYKWLKAYVKGFQFMAGASKDSGIPAMTLDRVLDKKACSPATLAKLQNLYELNNAA